MMNFQITRLMYSLTIKLRFSEKATFQVLPCQNFTCTSLKIFKHYKLKPSFSIIKDEKAKDKLGVGVELVSKELNHFGVIAGLFRQIGGHSSRFVLFCSF